MRFDCATGLELELVLPKGATRLDLLEALAKALGGSVEPFDFLTAVPLPEAASPEELSALIESTRRHHQAREARLSDGVFVLAHRAGVVLTSTGEPILSVVHDNTLNGGERVAEIVTVPFTRDGMPFIAEICRLLAAIDGVSLPEGAAVHVHADATQVMAAKPIARLVTLYETYEPTLRAWCKTSKKMKSAGPLPVKLADELRALASRAASYEAVVAVLRTHVKHSRYGLNLNNLANQDPNKHTVELKLPSATLDAERVSALRELFVAMVGFAVAETAMPETNSPQALALLLGVEPLATDAP